MLFFDFLISNFTYFSIYLTLACLIVPSVEAIFERKINIPEFIKLPFFFSVLLAFVGALLGFLIYIIFWILPSMNILAYNSSDEVRILQVNSTNYSIEPKAYRSIIYPRSSGTIKGINADNTQVFFETQLSGEGAYVANIGSEKLLEIEELPYQNTQTNQSLYENFGTRHLVNDIVLVDKNDNCTYHYGFAPPSLRSKYNSRHFILRTH